MRFKAFQFFTTAAFLVLIQNAECFHRRTWNAECCPCSPTPRSDNGSDTPNRPKRTEPTASIPETTTVTPETETTIPPYVHKKTGRMFGMSMMDQLLGKMTPDFLFDMVTSATFQSICTVDFLARFMDKFAGYVVSAKVSSFLDSDFLKEFLTMFFRSRLADALNNADIVMAMMNSQVINNYFSNDNIELHLNSPQVYRVINQEMLTRIMNTKLVKNLLNTDKYEIYLNSAFFVLATEPQTFKVFMDSESMQGLLDPFFLINAVQTKGIKNIMSQETVLVIMQSESFKHFFSAEAWDKVLSVLPMNIGMLVSMIIEAAAQSIVKSKIDTGTWDVNEVVEILDSAKIDRYITPSHIKKFLDRNDFAELFSRKNVYTLAGTRAIRKIFDIGFVNAVIESKTFEKIVSEETFAAIFYTAQMQNFLSAQTVMTVFNNENFAELSSKANLDFLGYSRIGTAFLYSSQTLATFMNTKFISNILERRELMKMIRDAFQQHFFDQGIAREAILDD